jgi:hypothetical protein
MPEEISPPPPPADRSSRLRRFALLAGGALVIYLVAAYVVAPLAWRTAIKRHPDLSAGPRITETANGIPGDPLNLAAVGSESELVRAMTTAGWYPADPITLGTSLRIGVDSVFRRPDDEAPVSNLFLFGRKQDLAFEEPVGDSPRQRHHVRFWKWEREHNGRHVWFGSATFDARVGLSRTTGQITHHIGPNIDEDRDRLLQELQQAGWAQEVYYEVGFHKKFSGKNGGGDPWHTDGRLGVVILQSEGTVSPTATSSPLNKPAPAVPE